MKESEDVTKLFAMFGDEKADQYREVYEADQNRATLERWPLFQRIRFGPSQQDAHQENAIVEHDAPRHPDTVQSERDVRPAPVVPASRSEAMAMLTGANRRREEAHSQHAPKTDSPLARAASGEGGLHSLFKRLEGSGEAAVIAQPAVAPSEPAKPSGSIHSLFNRLSRA